MAVWHYMGVGLGFGLTVLGAGIGIGKMAAGVAEAVARQPSAAAEIKSQTQLPLFLLEGVAILALIFGMAIVLMK